MILKTDRSLQRNIKDVYKEKEEKREAWFKLCVKVIFWKDKISNPEGIEEKAKISQSEWEKYRQNFLKINVIKGREKTLENLREIKGKILANGGFK